VTLWLAAILAGIASAAVFYIWREPGATAHLLPMAALRAIALTLLFALLFNAPGGRGRAPRPVVALDVSSSWTRGRDSTRWRSALASARRRGGDSVLAFGDSARPLASPATPSDITTRLTPLVERALGSGRPLIVVTDGEVDDPAAARQFPAGSRIEVDPAPGVLDVAVVSFDAPRAAVSGDTLTLRVTVRASRVASPEGVLSVVAGTRVVTTMPLAPIAAGAERSVELRSSLSAPVGATTLAAIVRVPGDVESRNDTLAVPLDVSRAAGAVLASSSPDFDARFLLPVLRGSVALPTRAYYRVAPGAWRLDGSLAAVPEADVRAAVRDAPLAILHGDSAMFGQPRDATTSALALIVPPADSGGEWYAVAAPPSPVAAALSGIFFDSLPPVDVGAARTPHDWEGLTVARARQGERRPVVLGFETPRRRVLVPGAGFWRWKFRGGVSADAYDAFWGSIFDWLSAERNDPRAAIPADGAVRAGDRVRWRRGNGADSVVVAVLRRRGAPPRTDTIALRFQPRASVAESDPLPAGVYDVSVRGGTSVLAVNASRELLPRLPTVVSGVIGGAPAIGDRPRARDRAWPYVIALLALCCEWLVRRRRGLR